ncbi:Hermansky-Pudlak syndrome 3 protein [Labeo rohita]|uniref:Hermansky-Pudlak syndrome 3 protein n=1 Tax=Labeo rohita TaxID=84645 RepID=A0ABQ8LM94_LABRO|nr:Hermansky-Pudlak syndrome 3 protein [Labeo rohita]
MAHSSLVSTVAHQSTSSIWLPHPSGSALVGCRPALASGLQSSGFALSLLPSGSVGHLPPFSSTFVLCNLADLADPRLRLSHLSHLLYLGSPSPPWVLLPPAPSPSVSPLVSSALPPPWFFLLLAPPRPYS